GRARRPPGSRQPGQGSRRRDGDRRAAPDGVQPVDLGAGRRRFTCYRGGSGGRPPLVGAGPGLLLDDEIALYREHAASLAQVEELDKVRVDVQLVAVLTQPAGDPEAQPFALVGETERRVEAGDDEAAAAARAPLAETGHAGWILDGAGSTADVPGILGTAKSGRHDPLVPRWPVAAIGGGARRRARTPGGYWTRRIVRASDQCFSSP